MSEPFVAEIRMFAFPFAPNGWAFCDGQMMQVSQNTALFSLIGFNYGGNGTTLFALPNLQDRVPIHAGQGPGKSYKIGDTGGETEVTLTLQTMATHTHTPLARNDVADMPSPRNNALARGTGYYQTDAVKNLVAMAPAALPPTGAATPQAHNNLQPYLVINYCIALAGDFPHRAKDD